MYIDEHKAQKCTVSLAKHPRGVADAVRPLRNHQHY